MTKEEIIIQEIIVKITDKVLFELSGRNMQIYTITTVSYDVLEEILKGVSYKILTNIRDTFKQSL